MYDCNFDQSVAWNIHMWYMIVFMMLPGRVIKNFIIFKAQTSCLFINHTQMLYGLLFQTIYAFYPNVLTYCYSGIALLHSSEIRAFEQISSLMMNDR